MVLYLLFWSLTAPVSIHFIIWEIYGHDRKLIIFSPSCMFFQTSMAYVLL